MRRAVTGSDNLALHVPNVYDVKKIFIFYIFRLMCFVPNDLSSQELKLLNEVSLHDRGYKVHFILSSRFSISIHIPALAFKY